MRELWTNLKFAWKYAKDQKWRIIAFAFCNVLTIVISIIVPIISAYIIVKLTANQLNQVVLIAIVLFGVEIIRNIIDFFCRYFAQVSYRETFTKLQLDLGNSILRLHNSCIDAHSSGVFIQRMTNDTSKIADVFNLLNFHLTDLLKDIGVFGAVLIIDYRVFIYMAAMILAIGFLERKRVVTRNEKD